MVVESCRDKSLIPFPPAAIYPKERTYSIDQAVVIVNRGWVTPEHRAAGQVFIDCPVPVQREKALSYGF